MSAPHLVQEKAGEKFRVAKHSKWLIYLGQPIRLVLFSQEKEFSVILVKTAVLWSPLQTNDGTVMFLAARGEHGRWPIWGSLGAKPGATCGCHQGPQSPGCFGGGVLIVCLVQLFWWTLGANSGAGCVHALALPPFPASLVERRVHLLLLLPQTRFVFSLAFARGGRSTLFPVLCSDNHARSLFKSCSAKVNWSYGAVLCFPAKWAWKFMHVV